MLLIFFYVGQTADVIIRKAMSEKKPWWLIIFPIAIAVAYSINHSLFIFAVIFALMFWSNSCRCSDYGISYAFFLLYVTAVVYGPSAAFLIGLFPILLAPLVRPDMQIIEVIITVIMLSVSGLVIGLISIAGLGFLGTAGMAMLVIYNIVISIFLFGKMGTGKIFISTLANIGINYYLMMNYIPLAVGLIGG